MPSLCGLSPFLFYRNSFSEKILKFLSVSQYLSLEGKLDKYILHLKGMEETE